MKINKDIFIQQGILDCQIDQLIKYSNTDSEIKKFTSDPIRFKDRNSFDHWLKQGRIIYSLIDKNHNLLGIIWFGHKIPPIKINANFSFAIRIYGSARGQRLSQIFMKTAFNDLLKNQSKSKISGFWLQVSFDNLPAVFSYQKFGFKQISQPDSSDKIIMTLEI